MTSDQALKIIVAERKAMRKLLREALSFERKAFDTDDEVNGGDLVEWFAEWRERVTATLTAEPAP